MLTPAPTEWVIYGIHSDASNNRPLLSLGSELEKALTCLDQRLIQTTASGNYSNCRHAFRAEPLHLSTWKLDNRLANIMSHQNCTNS
jgi:hypothetical protein